MPFVKPLEAQRSCDGEKLHDIITRRAIRCICPHNSVRHRVVSELVFQFNFIDRYVAVHVKSRHFSLSIAMSA